MATFMNVLPHLKWLFGHWSWFQFSKASVWNQSNSTYFPSLRLSSLSMMHSLSCYELVTNMVWWWIESDIESEGWSVFMGIISKLGTASVGFASRGKNNNFLEESKLYLIRFLPKITSLPSYKNIDWLWLLAL